MTQSMLSVFGKIIRLLFYALILALLVTVSTANREEITLSFFPISYTLTLPKYLLCIVVFLAGLACGAFIYASEILHANRTLRACKKQLQSLEHEHAQLKAKTTPSSHA